MYLYFGFYISTDSQYKYFKWIYLKYFKRIIQTSLNTNSNKVLCYKKIQSRVIYVRWPSFNQAIKKALYLAVNFVYYVRAGRGASTWCDGAHDRMHDQPLMYWHLPCFESASRPTKPRSSCCSDCYGFIWLPHSWSKDLKFFDSEYCERDSSRPRF